MIHPCSGSMEHAANDPSNAQNPPKGSQHPGFPGEGEGGLESLDPPGRFTAYVHLSTGPCQCHDGCVPCSKCTELSNVEPFRTQLHYGRASGHNKLMSLLRGVGPHSL